ncbi:MAG TPA: proprotein convertase P-domain-containing protein, partial [Pyrinomonadaceae bacterium]|nr:proprotein convertase P-domain-containing protein [Pyrinomonadaceae bacterium]
SLTVQLSNVGGAGATGISAVLTSTTPGLVVTQSSSTYPDITASGTANNAKPFTFKLPSNFICGSVLKFTLTVTFTGGQASPTVLPLTVPTGTTTAASATSANYSGGTVAIPDTNPGSVNIPLNVSGFTGAIGDLNFKIGGSSCNATTGATTNGINHTWVGDLSLTLVSPQGTSVTMISRAGGINNSGNNFCNTVLDDDTANGSIQNITPAGNPYTGTFKPANPLSVFDGENPNGTWTLTVTDAESPDSGNVTAFGLDITPFTCAAAPTSTISGRVADASNNGINLVSVKLTGSETQTTTTNSNGDYTFNLATCGGVYTVTPSLVGYTFSPPNRTFVNQPGSQTANFTGALGVTPTTLTPGQVLISEFRARGLAGATDEFVEIYNNTDSQITVGSSDGATDGWRLAALDASGLTATPIYNIPNGTLIPARSHYLVANGDGYTLDAYATGNAYFTGDIPDNTGVALFRNGAGTGAPFDAAGFTTPPPGVSDTYREGGGMAPVGTANGNYSFYRKLISGFPQDTGNNASDFEFVSPDAGTYGGRVAKLGAPGPENLSSPIQRNGAIKPSLVSPTFAAGASPNRVRSGIIVPGVPNAYGTLSIQRRFTNTLLVPVTRLRFRVTDVTTLNSPVVSAPQADMRVLNSTGIVRNSAGTTVITVTGLTLEEPATQILGGGLNSSLTVIPPGGALAPGASIDVQFLLGIQQEGSFRFFVNVEALPGV